VNQEENSLKSTTLSAVEKYLDEIFSERIYSAFEICDSYKEMWQNIKTSTISGGKRIRPYLTMIGFGGFSEDMVPIAASQELIHVAMLMHDDFIDEDITRRGHKNINGIYGDKYSKYLKTDRALHYGHGVSVIAGDTLISEAYMSIANSVFDDNIKAVLMKQLHQSIYEVVGGELIDIEASFITDVNYDPLKIYRYKTAGYSFVGPLISGAICSNQSTEVKQKLENFGIYAGTAFQLQDDLLGIFGEEAKIGKSILIDLKEAKHTYVIERHKSLMNDEQKLNFNAVFGDINAPIEKLVKVKNDIEASGAKQQTEELINELFTKAEESISELNSPIQRRELCMLLKYLKDRRL
jgi:geranylgeranyl pyrophosphate synthase